MRPTFQARRPCIVLGALLLVAMGGDTSTVVRASGRSDPQEAFQAAAGAAYQARAGDDEKAVERYRRLLSRHADFVEARRQLAAALLRLERRDEALEEYRRIARENPQDRQSLRDPLYTLIRLGRWVEAVEWLNELLAEDPEDPEFRRVLLRVLAASPDPAARDAERAKNLIVGRIGSSPSVDDAETLAMVAAENGEFTPAIGWQEYAARRARDEGASDRLPRLVKWLRSYREGIPCREPWPADGPELAPPFQVVPRDERPVPEILAAAVRDADPDENPFLNDERVAALDVRIAAEPEGRSRLDLKYQKAYELLRAGSTRDAIDLTVALLGTLDERGYSEGAKMVVDLRQLLAMCYIRLGEQENCIAHHTIDSCLMPITDSGVHVNREGSTLAVGELLRVLEKDGDNLTARWLLNLAHMTLGSYPQGVPEAWRIPPEAFAAEEPFGRFLDIAPELGLDVDDLAGGAVLEDFDRDGHLDLAVSSWGLADPLRYFHNNRDGTFSEWTEQAGLGGQLGGLNLIQADYDNDGYPDLLVLRGAWLGLQGQLPNSLLRNDGDGTFTDVTREAGVLSFHPTQVAAWADFNLDGWLDLFVGNESTPEDPNPSELYLNNRDGTFTDVAPQVGLTIDGFVKGAAWGDYDNDGWPDLYVSRYSQANQLFRNGGPDGYGWMFEDVAPRAGVREPRFGFPVWFWDFDNDGWEDLLVAPLDNFFGDSLEVVVADYLGLSNDSRAGLYRNNGDGTFTDMTEQAGLGDTLLAMGANFGDLDNDGFLDCYFGTGQPRLNTLVPNRMYRNAGGTFRDVTASGGFGHLQKGHGIAFGDIDNDGDQDVYAVLGGAFSGDRFQNALFENPGHGNRWITLRLEGVRSNRLAVGARIRVTVRTATGSREIHRTVGSGGSFGASSLQQEIGLGQAEAIEAIEIRWPRPAPNVQTITEVEMDRVLTVREQVKRGSSRRH